MSPVVDAHQHVWDLDRAHYPWLQPDMTPLDRTYDLADVAGEQARAGVDQTVLIQAGDNDDDTANMFRSAAEHPGVAGVVAWAPLDHPEEAAAALDRWARAGPLVGVRHLVHREPDPNWLLRPEVGEGLSLVATLGLTFDVCAETTPLLAHVPSLAERFPSLRLVIDHLAKPPIRGHGWQPWADLLRQAAAAPNVYAKVSGLNTAADPVSWTSEDFRPYVEHAVEVFGPARLMCGSDWPFALLAAHNYGQIWTALARTLDILAAPERSAILGGTATSFYRLKPSSGHLDARSPAPRAGSSAATSRLER